LPDPPFVLVADVGGFEGDAGGVDRQDLIDDRGEGQIGHVRSVPGTPAGVDAHLGRVDAAQSMVERVDADLGERAVVVVGRLGVDLGEVLGQGRVVDLDGQTRLGDGEVFLTQHFGPRPDELLFGLVVLIGDAGGRTGGQRIDVTVALVVTGS